MGGERQPPLAFHCHEQSAVKPKKVVEGEIRRKQLRKWNVRAARGHFECRHLSHKVSNGAEQIVNRFYKARDCSCRSIAVKPLHVIAVHAGIDSMGIASGEHWLGW